MADKNGIPIIPSQIKTITQEMVDLCITIIRDFANGLTLKGAVSKSEMQPDQFFAILVKVPELAQRYDIAQKSNAELIASEVIDISDDLLVDYGRARNMVDARKWVASKYNAKRFGDKLELDVQQPLSIGDALNAAKRRTALVPEEDHDLIETPQTTESITYEDIFDTDSVSARGEDDPY